MDRVEPSQQQRAVFPTAVKKNAIKKIVSQTVTLLTVIISFFYADTVIDVRLLRSKVFGY